VRNFSFTVVDGKIYYRENSRMNPVDVSATAESRIKGMIGIRDCVRTLIEYQTEDYPDADIKSEQEKLNRLYDDFSKKYGLISARANNSTFNSDSSYCLLASLEVLDDEGNEHQFEILDAIETDDGRYVALLPVYSDAEEAIEEIKEVDRSRKSYHNYYCDTKWGDARGYDLVVNSGKLGIEKTVDTLVAYVRAYQAQNEA